MSARLPCPGSHSQPLGGHDLGHEEPWHGTPQLGVDRPASGPLLCEEAFQQQHLDDADHKRRSSHRKTSKRPGYSGLRVQPGPGLPGADSASESQSPLPVCPFTLQGLVNGHTGRLHLSRKRRAGTQLTLGRTGGARHTVSVVVSIRGDIYGMFSGLTSPL